MFAVIHLPQFFLQAALRHEPEQWFKPVALVDPAMSTPRICDATEPARLAGISDGATPTQALARCATVSIRPRSTGLETAATDALLQCAYGFSPHIEATWAGLCTLDLRGLAALKDGNPLSLARWAGQLRQALAGLNLRARIGVGPTPNIARHAARWAGGIEIVEDPKQFLASLPVMALEPSSDVVDILGKWGIRTVGELLALGQEAVVDRLGLEALALFAAASTGATRPLKLVQPSETFEELFEFEHEIETLEPLLFILRRFVDQLSRRLEGVGFVAETLTLKLWLESGEILERQLRIPEATREADTLFRILQTHLETVRASSPIRSVSLAASPGRPTVKQFGLFETVFRDPRQFQETLARLAALLGEDRVGTPVLENSHRPDAFRLAPPDFENAPDVLSSRVAEILRATPLRRIRPAAAAQVGTEGVEGEVTPVSLRCAVANGRLQVTVGPWRASGQWWEAGAWQRDEWDASTSDGKVIRLVRHSTGWSVEAILD
ncbi:MAG: DNA polymerase Y family protein [Opitutaceae bacterium]|nr:DNA polymerase Y family protein [Verrucomicrobiales bacterium]